MGLSRNGIFFLQWQCFHRGFFNGHADIRWTHPLGDRGDGDDLDGDVERTGTWPIEIVDLPSGND